MSEYGKFDENGILHISAVKKENYKPIEKSIPDDFTMKECSIVGYEETEDKIYLVCEAKINVYNPAGEMFGKIRELEKRQETDAKEVKEVREKIDKVSNDVAGLGNGSGLNDTAKRLLIEILRNGVYSTNQSGNIRSLEAALDGSAYMVTSHLTNVTLSNNATSVADGKPYTTTLQAASAYQIQDVKVTMGGVDVTALYYNINVVDIPSVTGDIEITAYASKTGDNLIKLEQCTSGDTMPDGAKATDDIYLATPFIDVKELTVYKHNITAKQQDGSTLYNQKMYQYNEEKKYINVKQINGSGDYAAMTSVETDAGISYVRLLFSATHSDPYFGLSGEVE